MNLKGEVDWIKLQGDPDAFFALPAVDKYFKRANSSFAWVGHNRSATIGENTTNNAHPFQHSNIVGVHNGTIRNKWELTDSGYKFQVDSDALFNGIKLHGAKETLAKVDGAYSIVYFDSDDATINFARNDQRPMHFLKCTEKSSSANVADKEFIFFGSELGMLGWICARNGFICGEHHPSKVLTHYKFRIGEEKPLTSELEAYVGKWQRAVSNITGVGIHTTNPPFQAARREHKKTPMILIGTKPIGDNEIIPELRKLPFMLDMRNMGQDKKTLERIYRGATKGAKINFKVTEMVDLVTSFQLIGRPAGRKKESLPIFITTVVDKTWMQGRDSSEIYSAVITERGFTPDNKNIQIIVANPHEIFNNVKEEALSE